MTSNNLEKTLPKYEKISALLLIACTIFLICCNLYLNDDSFPETSEKLPLSQQLIEITVEGEVGAPGVYRVKKGTLTNDVIKMARPKETANLKRFKPTSKVVRKRRIIIK